MPHRDPTARMARVAGHFGELVQGRLGPEGPLALRTLPCAALAVRARAAAAPGFSLHAPGPRPVAAAAAARLWRAAAGGPPRVRITLRTDMPPGGGAGASTAALIALARLADPGIAPDRAAALALAAEGATDPLALPDPAAALWAPRAARVLVPLPPLPGMEVVGGFDGPGLRTDPADLRFADVSDLVDLLAAADLPGLARVATESARRNAALRGDRAGPPRAGHDALVALAAAHGALGVVAAHTGVARGLIFAPGAGDPAGAARALRALGLTGVLRFRAGGGR